MNADARERLIELLDEHENAAERFGGIEEGDMDQHWPVVEARLKIIGLFESLEPKEEP